MNTGIDVKNNEHTKLGRVWLTLSAGPALFLVLIIIASIIVLTGVVAGGLFSALFAARRNILAPFAAHLALNTVEFLLIWLMR